MTKTSAADSAGPASHTYLLTYLLVVVCYWHWLRSSNVMCLHASMMWCTEDSAARLKF